MINDRTKEVLHTIMSHAEYDAIPYRPRSSEISCLGVRISGIDQIFHLGRILKDIPLRNPNWEEDGQGHITIFWCMLPLTKEELSEYEQWYISEEKRLNLGAC